MKNLLTFFISCLALSIWAQDGFHYQGVLRDADGQLARNESIDLRFRLLADRDQPNLFDFEEEHLDISTDQFGVFRATIGSQDPDAMSSLDFSQKFFLEVAIRTTDQRNYQMLHRNHLMTAPYAMHALTASDVDDADADPANELQQLSFDAASNTLSISEGNAIQIPTGGSDADADPENELQTLDFDPLSSTLSISNGNQIEIPRSSPDGDGDPTNEIQTLTKSGNTIMLSGGGEVVDETMDADADPENEIQTLAFDPLANELSISGGNSILLPAHEDADADPENELQLLDFDARNNRLSISGGNAITLPMGGGSDADDDPENELQRISLLGNGNLILSHGGGEVALNQSPLVPTTDTRGRFAYKLNQKLAINKNRPHAEAELDVSGIIRTDILQTREINVPADQQGTSRLFIRDASGRHMASFTGQTGNTESNLLVDQLRIGRGTVRLHSPKSFSGEFWVSKEGRTEKLMRIGDQTSAISTKDLFVSQHLHVYHPSHSTGQTGLRIYNTSAHNYWNLYTSASNGNLEFWYKGAIKARISSINGSLITNSDFRLKDNIRPLERVMPSVMKLQAKRYHFTSDDDQQENIGFITQEVQDIFPELVYQGEESEFQGLKYQEFSALAIKAIQEQQVQIEAQAQEIDSLKTQMAELKAALRNLQESFLEASNH